MVVEARVASSPAYIALMLAQALSLQDHWQPPDACRDSNGNMLQQSLVQVVSLQLQASREWEMGPLSGMACPVCALRQQALRQLARHAGVLLH